MQFTEENIERLFGNEAAESENLARLREYYVKNSVFEQVTSDSPLRILVGHKGVGKSALIKVALSEESDRGILTLLIRPDDILSVASDAKPLLELIRDWKVGLSALMAERAIS